DLPAIFTPRQMHHRNDEGLLEMFVVLVEHTEGETVHVSNSDGVLIKSELRWALLDTQESRIDLLNELKAECWSACLVPVSGGPHLVFGLELDDDFYTHRWPNRSASCRSMSRRTSAQGRPSRGFSRCSASRWRMISRWDSGISRLSLEAIPSQRAWMYSIFSCVDRPSKPGGGMGTLLDIARVYDPPSPEATPSSLRSDMSG